MRITAGAWRGRNLLPPADKSIRPTSDKVRQALFNMLTSRDALADAVALDICCGTGALGLEALSRGAAHCVFIDRDRGSLDLCRKNAVQCGAGDTASFLFADAAKLPAAKVTATLAFIDPPYRQNLVPAILQGLAAQDWLADDAIIVAETERGAVPLGDDFTLLQSRDYGDTTIHLVEYRKTGTLSA
jgi:16S rRNA (guanine966-N2)-methyltransferase